ncbi:MerR family transcriptional regulator [Paraconexibacter algicola]|uniref:HTH merR-type domain-containing protein n=1 Tax=Paraconexibacter algicola TaxID=2133960 RepID=A0A2T4UJG4_9ACTN|nr:helix-turn-helix domain-containing protein [Paraconexibacter algicola]PTL59369.1 hypothetical protein C7Y72_06725 [Paraconexibacter algicola]
MREPRTTDAPLSLTVSAAAEYLGVSAATVRRWERSGDLVAYRTPGGQRRFDPADLDAFLAARRALSRVA